MPTITVSVDFEQITDQISWGAVDENDVFEFVKQIDEQFGVWSLTDRLHKHFKKEMKRARKEGWIDG